MVRVLKIAKTHIISMLNKSQTTKQGVFNTFEPHFLRVRVLYMNARVCACMHEASCLILPGKGSQVLTAKRAVL